MHILPKYVIAMLHECDMCMTTTAGTMAIKQLYTPLFCDIVVNYGVRQYPVYRDCYCICILPMHLENQLLLSISSYSDFS